MVGSESNRSISGYFVTRVEQKIYAVSSGIEDGMSDVHERIDDVWLAVCHNVQGRPWEVFADLEDRLMEEKL